MQEIPWQDRGRVTLCSKGWPKFPTIEQASGLYRLVLDSGWVYIGEAKNLQYRLDDYRTGNTGLIQETRVHVALIEAGGAAVSIFTAPHLAEKTSRCMVEADAVRAAREAGQKVLNGAQPNSSYGIHLDINFHELQITKLRAKLALMENKFREDSMAEKMTVIHAHTQEDLDRLAELDALGMLVSGSTYPTKKQLDSVDIDLRELVKVVKIDP